ncbi:hypothetical protein M422DRAFT_230962 [Sphaerobolus stellatus SS14]|uniref:Kinesin-like protein n=1 Tax=Sphaerobolus stellatus (strain SS14) TaxID=990650 RepID=A0A0C9VM14_SPHS4|nr:hypothetical protein M422DRAFT_230962 [Sphaerobolus stellatus SS14]
MAAKVKVSARLRPFVNNETSDDAVIVNPEEGTISISNPRPGATDRFKFSFTSCYDQSATQEEIFMRDVQPLIEHAFNGLVCTVFAYGVTSSGKTHTIQGNVSEPGIIPRVVKAILERKHLMDQGSVSIAVSYMEIYKDDVYDLLVARENAPKLPIREDMNGKIFVANLSEKSIGSFQEFDRIYSHACKSRSTGSTNLNRASSRSHALLTLTVTKLDVSANKVLIGKVNLVDLAGSENNKLTGNDPSRMAESSAINKSLTVLGQVVHALNTGASRIPYRDSKLTRILQDALGGSSIGLLICNLAPGVKFRQDTLNTLNFATRTKQIENRPVVNERDTRPAAKPHFAAAAPARAPLGPRQSAAHARISMGGAGTGSHIPKLNGFGYNPASARPSLGGQFAPSAPPKPDPLENLEEKITKAVQQEVERRLAERETQERQRIDELERLERERTAELERQAEEQRAALMKKHDELNKLLKKTLRKAEKENQRVSEGDSLEAKVLSPKTAKRIAMSYVSLGRAYLTTKQPDYSEALSYWQKAEGYVPDNKALKKRIAELQIAIREGIPFRMLKSARTSHSVDSPSVASPSGSRDHKESQRLRLRHRKASAKAKGELVQTPSPSKKKRDAAKQQKEDVFLDSDEEMEAACDEESSKERATSEMLA